MAEEPLTEQLLAELLARPDVESVIGANGLVERDLPGYLAELLGHRGLKQSKVVQAAGLSPTYGYQIFKGERRPSREKLLAIAFALGATLRETGRILQAGGAAALYAKNRRDAIIIFCLDRGYSLADANTALYEHGEQPIDSAEVL